MNFTLLLRLLPYLPKIVSFFPLIQKLISRGFSLNAILQDLQDPQVVDYFKTIGGIFFPSVRDDLQVAAGASTVAPDYVMKIQKLLNQVMTPSPGLDVDGQYGPKTRAAVKAYQQAKGLVVDEFAGDATMAALLADNVKTVPTALGGGGEKPPVAQVT